MGRSTSDRQFELEIEAPQPTFKGPYRLSLLGSVECLSVGGERANLPPGKPTAVACYLALHPEGVEQDQLAGLLWGTTDLPEARHSVRRTLSKLQDHLGRGIFASESPVRLQEGAVRTDLEDLRDAIRRGEVDLAEGFWRGEPLSGVSISGEVGWDSWVADTRNRAKGLLVAGLEERALALEEDGGIDEAVEALRRAALLMPQRVEIWSRLVQLQIDSGQEGEAGTSLAEAQSHLAEDLYEDRLGPLEGSVRMSPDAATVDATEAIAAREADLAAAGDMWLASTAGTTGFLVFEGGDGRGKTRLLEEVASPVVTPGAQIVRVTSSAARPWSAAAEWVS